MEVAQIGRREQRLLPYNRVEIRKNIHVFMESMMKDRSKIIDRLCIRMESGAVVEDL